MKYSNAFNALSTIMAAAGRPVWPRDVVPTNRPMPYGELSFIPSDTGVNLRSISGIVIVDIITEAGRGPSAALSFADTLDSYLVNMTIGTTQFFWSTLAPRGTLRSDNTKERHEYTISFKYFGT